MNGFRDETIAADRVFRVMDAGIGEAARWAGKRLVAVGKSDDEQRVGGECQFFELVHVLDAVEEEVIVADVRLFLEARL